MRLIKLNQKEGNEMLKFNGLYHTTTPDCCENEGGLFVQVYADENLENELDSFVIDKVHLENQNDEDAVLLKFLKGELEL